MEEPKNNFYPFLALWWALLGVIGVCLFGFRVVKTSNLSNAFRLEDIPLLDNLDYYYTYYFLGLALLSLVGLGAAIAIFRNQRFDAMWRRASALLMVLSSAGLLYSALPDGGFVLERPDLRSIGILDWVMLDLYAGASLALLFFLPKTDSRLAVSEVNRGIPRWALIYLIATGTLLFSALREHLSFWDDTLLESVPTAPSLISTFGGEEYRFEANLLLYSTSLLFVSLISGLAVVGYFAFRRKVSRPAEAFGISERQNLWAAAMMAIFWAAVFGVPWLTKLLPEIRKEGVWIFPVAVLLVILFAGVVVIYATMRSLRLDLIAEEKAASESKEDSNSEDSASESTVLAGIRPSDLAFIAFSTAAIYPFVRMAFGRFRRCHLPWMIGIGLILMVGGGIATSYVTDWFSFDDWRDMLKRAQFPTMKVAFSLASIWGVYSLVGILTRRFKRRAKAVPTAKKPLLVVFWGLRAIALAVAIASTFPFWGHGSISENTFARAVEHSNHHAYEVQFLHSLFDFDLDGYAGILHGSDPDDFNSDIQGFGFPPLALVDMPTPRVEIVDQAKADAFPNVVILYLEGCTTDAINLYGRRSLRPSDLVLPEDWSRDDLVAVDPTLRSPTPFMDDIGLRGTAFDKCRTVYPSTWDGWMQTQSGRHMMISEFSVEMLNQDHYSRYNVIDHLCREVGFNRFCYANSSPYAKAFVSGRHQKEDWEPDADLSTDEFDEENGIWEGDNQMDRILRFIRSLDEGERFFIAEHMDDGHFPWEETSDVRARTIGAEVNYHYNGSFDWVMNDGTSKRHQRFLNEVTRIDAQIGVVTNALKKKGVWDNTIVIIMGDHGCQWHQHQHGYYVSHLYEEAINPPLLIKVPGLEAQAVVDTQVQQADIVPTLLELAGARIANSDQFPLDGKSLVPFLKGEADQSYRNQLDSRSMLMKTHYDKVGYIHEGRYKLIADRPYGTVRLFDLKNDPKEMVNIADQEPEILAMMRKKMAEMAKEKMALLVGVTPPKSGEDQDQGISPAVD